jgi:short-chain fatty acids transporter
MRNVVRKLSETLHFGMEKVTPDSMIFALILTFIVFVLALVAVKATPLQIVAAWHKGFWAYLAFSMQMVVLLIFAFSFAMTKVGAKVLDKISSVPKTPAGAVAWVCFVAILLALVNWGLGLAGSIFLVLGVARRVKGVHWPLLVASAYIGAETGTIWSMSITEPLLLNQVGWGWSPDVIPAVEKTIGMKLLPMGFDKTIYAPASIVGMVIGIIVAPVLCYMMHPVPEKTKTISEEALKGLSQLADVGGGVARGKDIADRLNWSRTLWLLAVIMFLVAGYLWFSKNSFLQLDLNMFNFIFIMLALILHGSIPRFVESIRKATEASYGIILQFPFYAGIFGMMAYTGLLQAIANWFAGISTPFLYPLITMIASGVMNMFIPSSGGIWMVQGPPTIIAASKLGVPFNRVAMAFTAGEVITNAIQPFWALPLLGATKTEMRNIMGYCIVTTIVIFVLVALCYLYLPM